MVTRDMGRQEGTLARGGARLLCAALAGILCLWLAFVCLPARAAFASDDAPAATLTLTMECTAGEKTSLVDGIEATAYRVASLDDAVNHYELLPEFAELGVDFNAGMTIQEMEAAAKKAATIAKAQGVTGVSATSDTNGVAAFGQLPYGVYLVVQTGATGSAKNYSDFEPFLISVPQVTEGDVVFDVNALPKLTPKDTPKPPEPEEPEKPKPEPEPKPKKPMPWTGDNFDPALVLALAGAGLLLMAVGLVSRSKKSSQG